ncbi:SAM-dependent methyltransferase, partial [Vibrio breoganii]
VVASSVCGFIPNLQDTVSLIYTLLENDGTFVHWDWYLENDSEDYGVSQQRSENVLSAAGFAEVEVSTPFSIDTPQGELKVLMGVGRKQVLPH